jgi:hypothetical protein
MLTKNNEIMDHDEYFKHRDISKLDVTIMSIREEENEQMFDRINFWRALKADRGFRLNFIGIVICNCVSSFIIDLFSYIIPNLQGNIYMNAISVGTF